MQFAGFQMAESFDGCRHDHCTHRLLSLWHILLLRSGLIFHWCDPKERATATPSIIGQSLQISCSVNA